MYSSAQIYETLSPLNGQVSHNTLAFIRRATVALDKWYADCDELHRGFQSPKRRRAVLIRD